MPRYERRRSTVANVNYHIIWSTKRRKRVIVPELAADLKIWMHEAASRHGFSVRMAECGHRDHLHIFVSAPPKINISFILQILKGYTARRAFSKYQFLSKAYPNRHMWNPSSSIETIGCISEDIIAKYISKQDYDGFTERRKEVLYGSQNKERKARQA